MGEFVHSIYRLGKTLFSVLTSQFGTLSMTMQHTAVSTRLPHKSIKAYPTMRIGIMGSKSLTLLEESIDTHVRAVSFHHAETPCGSVKQP